ncbi:MAG TPA: hypothetical protein VKU91_00780 [Acidimicrobiales bacterium]|nr:hypothetical protein [Acidimicrobiales bacterium]
MRFFLRRRIGAAATTADVALLAVTGVVATAGGRAFADATAPPPIDQSQCPAAQAPPPGYPNPPPTASDPYMYKGKAYYGMIRDEVPFSGSIDDGQVSIPPNVVVPHIFASVCGLVLLPELSGTIEAGDVHFPADTPNVYVSGLEALPITLTFTAPLTSTMSPVPAANGGLDVAVTASNEGSTCSPSAPRTSCPATSLGMSCSVVLNAVTFTTQASGRLTGQPITGPTRSGQAMLVSNDFPVPAVQASSLCPPAVAYTLNKLLGLPKPAGEATFTAPFKFDFELTCPPLYDNVPADCPTRSS